MKITKTESMFTGTEKSVSKFLNNPEIFSANLIVVGLILSEILMFIQTDCCRSLSVHNNATNNLCVFQLNSCEDISVSFIQLLPELFPELYVATNQLSYEKFPQNLTQA